MQLGGAAGDRCPGGRPGGASRPSSVPGDPPVRSGRIVATDLADRASRASSVAVPEVGSTIVDPDHRGAPGHAPGPGHGCHLAERQRRRGRQVDPHVGAGGEAGLVLRRALPAAPLGHREHAGGHGEHREQRRTGLAQRPPADLPCGHGGHVAAPGRRPVAEPDHQRQQPQQDHRSGGQGQTGALTSTGSMPIDPSRPVETGAA